MNYRNLALILLLIALVLPATATIIGTTWNQSNSSPSAFFGCWGANYAPMTCPNFDTVEPWASMGRVNNSATQYQTMVQVKRHYIKTENITLAGGIHWMNFSISDVPAAGYTTDPWHVINGTEVPLVYIGAFEGAATNTTPGYNVSGVNAGDFGGVSFSTDKLSSVAGVKPMSGLNVTTATLPNFRLLAQNRGTGWELQPFTSMSVIERMYIIEYRNWDSQTVIGSGVTQITDDATTNMAINTGLTGGVGANSTNCGNTTCSVTTVHYKTGQTTNQISYRGIEAFYGNIYKWVDGLNIKTDNNPWRADHSFASDTFAAPYTNTGLTLPAANGYASNLAYAAGFDWAFLPSAAAGSSSTYLCDYNYQNTGNRAALFGGVWSNGAYAGAFDWYLNFAASFVSRSIGARAAFTPPVVANFTYNNSTATVLFTDTSYNISTKTGLITSPTSWNWSFGNGNVSSLQNPSQNYVMAGTYTVNLTVSDGTNYATSLQQVITSGSGVSASFTPPGPISLTYPNNQTFNDTSTGSPTAWNWTYQVSGVGTAIPFNTSRNATFSPPSAGNFTIALNASTTTAYNISTQVTWVNVSSSTAFSAWSPYGDAWKATNDTTTLIMWNATGSHTWVATGNASVVNYLVVGAGGSGGSAAYGGGGSGGNVSIGTLFVYGNIPVFVGNGVTESSGENSILSGIVAKGGVKGGSYDTAGSDGINTSGAGGGGSNSGGKSGGSGFAYHGGSGATQNGGGGGGFSSDGTNGVASSSGGNGGTGYISTLLGTPLYYSAGGAGGSNAIYTPGTGGNSIGGNGGKYDTYAPSAGTAGTGSGGGGCGGGTFPVGGDGGSGVVIIAYLTATPAPIASFTAVPTTGASPLSVTFTDTSTNSPTSWNWSLQGYGTNTSHIVNWSTVQNPVASFTTGNFSIVEGAGNSGGFSLSSPAWINVSAPAADPNPTSMIRYKAGSSTIQINNWTPYTGTVVSRNVTSNTTSVNGNFTWDTKWFAVSDLRINSSSIAGTTLSESYIGNGYATFNVSKPSGMTPSANAILDFNITYVNYTTPGTLGAFSFDPSSKYYDPVNVTFWNYNAIVGANAITGNWGTPVINFAANTTTPTMSSAVQFTDSSTNYPNAWSWDFGDGSTSTLQNPMHIYTTTGLKSVTLHAYLAANTSITNTSTKTDYINVIAGGSGPGADFSATPLTTTIGSTVTFSDLSTGSPTAWSWNFGDFSASTLQNPTHAYSALGLYTVNLTVSNLNGTSTLSKTSYINVTNGTPSGITDADITMAPSFVLTLHVTDSSTGSAIPDVTLLDSNGNTYTTTNGTFYLSYPYSAVVLYLTSTGYVSKSVSYIIDSDQTQTVQMVASTTTVANTNIVYTQQQTRFITMDANGTRLLDARIQANYISSTLPSNSLTTLENAFGINDQIAADMLNSSIAMVGSTGSDGSLTFMMFPSLTYNMTITNVPDAPWFISISPRETEYTLHQPTALPVSSYTQTQNSSITIYEPNNSYIQFRLVFQDTSGLTTNLKYFVKDTTTNTLLYSYDYGNPGTHLISDYNETVLNVRGETFLAYVNTTP
jgi:PKD repeat protein